MSRPKTGLNLTKVYHMLGFNETTIGVKISIPRTRETLLMVNFGQNTDIFSSWNFPKKNTQTAEIFLETTFGFKKTATQKFYTTFGFTKTTQTSISRRKSSSKSWSNEFQNLKFWRRAIWNKFQMLKCAKMSTFLVTKSPVFM